MILFRDIRYNLLSGVHNGTFTGLTSLQWLYLGGNDISQIENEAFDNELPAIEGMYVANYTLIFLYFIILFSLLLLKISLCSCMHLLSYIFHFVARSRIIQSLALKQPHFKESPCRPCKQQRILAPSYR